MSEAFPTSPTDSGLPQLSSTDTALFNLFASLHLDLHAVADTTGRGLTELTDWASAPHIRRWTLAYLDLAALTRALRFDSFLATSLNALVQTINATANPIEKRRAATAIVRACCSPQRTASVESPRANPARTPPALDARAVSSGHPIGRAPASPNEREHPSPIDIPHERAAPPASREQAPPAATDAPSRLRSVLRNFTSRDAGARNLELASFQPSPPHQARRAPADLAAAAGRTGPAPPGRPSVQSHPVFGGDRSNAV